MTEDTQDRVKRTLETREKEKRVWRPNTYFPTLKPEKGMRFRWVRASTLGEADPVNLGGKLRSGYEPVKASDYPETLSLYEVTQGRLKGFVESGGLVLCRMPEEMVQQRTEYYNNTTKTQIESVDKNYMRENDSRMPLLKAERKSKIQFGTGD